MQYNISEIIAKLFIIRMLNSGKSIIFAAFLMIINFEKLK